ncbi:thiol:disulfide interchange protein DsbA/DsbL [Aromatoleum toluolicum]|uniref:Thiol:disulfide interchange protein n=1 Tax=Aromatoleum toluolicum TaxID=90060 RepID=A0ABX1NM87_9RHOO|nr:thiol:disulfide interchange protein DsbA/DsbL [Aromatoleum toluolicum]NMG00450.1 thiol:disulfide interchange protein DsbA/DsbL [Aromatoleum toluolicum]
MNRRAALKQLSALSALSFLGGAAWAQKSGQPFQTLATKVATEVPGKIEVIEFFSYGCPHCHDFEPLLNTWTKTLPGDVNFIKVPITFNRAEWTNLARIYYTLDAMGEAGKHGAAVFAAIHEQKRQLQKEDVLLEWIGSVTDAKRFSDTWKSFGVQSRLQRANQIAAAYRVSGVPMMAVDGRFMVSASTAGSHEGMLKTVNELVARARSEKGKG